MKKVKKKKKFGFIKGLFKLFCFGIFLGIFLLYGPWHGFRDFWITTAMTTMNHQYLATTLYGDELIDMVMSGNTVIESNETIDTDLIDIFDEGVTNTYKDEYDKQVLEHKKGEIYKYFKVTGYKFDAYMAVVYDASKISLVHTKYLGSAGQYLVDMARENNAVLAINGGGFYDPDGLDRNGGIPEGILIENGKILQATRNRSHGGGVIGFTYDNKLYIGNVSAKEAIEAGVRDAVEFGPFLVVNGKPSFVQGNGGFGIHPRTAIGQRQDGVVLFLVVDGRRIDSVGASVKDLTDIMVKYGAYNAANLDGGNSSVMVINNKIVNRPINWGNDEVTRPIADGFIVKE